MTQRLGLGFCFLVFPLLLFPPSLQAQTTSKESIFMKVDVAARSRGVLNINDLSLWVQNDGILGQFPFVPPGTSPDPPAGPVSTFQPSHWGLVFPRSVAGLGYADGIVWVGKVQDGRQPIIRTVGGHYYTGMVPGVIVSKGVAENPESPDARVYRIRKDYATADLRLDASESFNVPVGAVTPEQLEAVRSQYEKDWKEWPWQKGAPFKDLNRNGVMDGDDYPDCQEADQVVWFACNDLDENMSKGFYGGPSTGLEVQVTLWAYRGISEIEKVIFKRYRFVYKGTASTPLGAVIDSLFFSQWADPDVGNYWDDLGGCDPALSLGFAYSSTSPDKAFKSYTWQNPAVGYVILQGPLVPGAEADKGIFDFAERRGVKNLPMTSFLLNATGDAISEPSRGAVTYWFWNQARGFVPYSSTQRWINPTGEVTNFMASGDPVAGTGWVDGMGKTWSGPDYGFGISVAPGERRFIMNTGPFTMALGDTQEVVIAIVAAMGSDGKYSVAAVKHATRLVRGIYPLLAEKVQARSEQPMYPTPVSIPKDFSLSQNYPNPFNPATHIRYAIPIDATVRLSVFDVLGREIKVLADATQPAGWYALEWNGTDDKNNLVPSGVYFYRLMVKDVELTKKMMIVR